MSNLLFFMPFVQDDNGDPISGAKAYFYVTGTTTEQAIYEDDALATPHDNPVIADSDGSFAPIYLDTTLVYKLVLKDADDLTIRTYDPINAATSSVWYLKERSAADTDKAGYGQFWVKDDTPNTPWFTNDAGTDFQLASLAGTETLTNKTIADADEDSSVSWTSDDVLGITIAGSAYTLTKSTNDLQVNIPTGDGLRISSTATADFRLLPFNTHIYFQNTSTGDIYFTGANAASLTGNVRFRADSGAVEPWTTDVTDLGTTTRRWDNIAGVTLQLKPVTVANLPTGAEGDIAFVTDANATTRHSTVAGSGANNVLVFHNGTNWIIA